MRHGFGRFVIAVVVFALAGGAAACTSLSPYAARVNGESIPTSALDEELEAILSNTSYLEQVEAAGLEGGVTGVGEKTFSTAFVGRILTRQIFFELIDQEVSERGLTISATDREAAALEVRSSFGEDPALYRAFPEAYRDDLIRRSAQVSALQADLSGVNVDEAAVQEFYDENEAQFSQTCASHILVATVEEANVIRAQIEAGGDFAAAASASSTDPGSAANGGELGCVPAGSFVAEFETAMDALAPGQLSQPVQTEFGFHLIQVTERRAQPLDEVRAQIRQQLLSGGQAEFDTFIQQAVTDADIEVNPRYGRFSLEGGQPEIIPPSAPTPDSTSPEGSDPGPLDDQLPLQPPAQSPAQPPGQPPPPPG